MKTCPYCGEEIQDAAVKCRYCKEFLPSTSDVDWGVITRPRTLFWSYEYRSSQTLFGLPLVHIVYGLNPETGLPRVARGIVAIGNFAVGIIALGGFAIGLLTLAGIGIGGVIFAGIALGGWAVGGIAVGLQFAVGGLAVSMGYALGGLAISPRSDNLICALFRLVPGLSKWIGDLCP